MGKEKVSSKIEAFVLRDCGFGRAGEVITLPQAAAETGAAHGMLDLSAAAVNAAKASKAA